MRRRTGLKVSSKYPLLEVKSTVFAILLICLFTQPALGQVTTGSLNGTVSDPSGASVAGATVTLVNTETGAERSGISSSTGTLTHKALSGLYPPVLLSRLQLLRK